MFNIIDNSSFGRGLQANADIAPQVDILNLESARRLDEPTMYSVYAGGAVHLDDPVLSCLNHSCSPNVFIDTAAGVVTTSQPVMRGDLLTFFYPATEWAMTCPFMCGCGSLDCIGLVVGAVFTARPALERHRLNSHIVEMLANPQSWAGLSVTVAKSA